MSDDKNKILTGRLTEMESGESWNVEFRPFLTDVVLMAIVQVASTEMMPNIDDPNVTKIVVNCQALDSIGYVYELGLEFMTDTIEQRDQIVADMKIGAIFVVKGRYSICQGACIIDLQDPEYLPLPPSLDEQEVREIFKVNGHPLSKIQ
jgi:hypothetical protein